jgi:hypothetical protein
VHFSTTKDTNDYARTRLEHLFLTYVCTNFDNYALAKCAPTVCSLSFVAFVSNLNAESIINTWNVPAKTKMESNKRREGMYNIIDFQLMGGLSEHNELCR